MNREIKLIVEDMKKHCKETPIANSDKQTYLMVQSSRLSVLLAEETEAQNKEVSKQTEKIIKLTKAIYVLTFTLLGVAIIQVIVALTRS